VVVGDGSPALAPDTTAAALIDLLVGASSSRPQMGTTFITVVAGDDIVEELRAVHGHPLLRAPGDISLDEQWGQPTWCSTKHSRCFTESVMTSMLSVGASYSGPRCSRSE
jgi:hypothetical protein